MDKLTSMSGMLDVIGENYDYISEHANLAGEAAFESADVGSKAYKNLANDFAASLNKMKNDNQQGYNEIVNQIYSAMGTSANEVANADAYIVNVLNSNNKALNAGLNEAAVQTARANKDVTVAMGDMFSALGTAISNFKFSIKAEPYITGSFGFKRNENGELTGISLPTFGFDITGSGGDSIQGLGAAVANFGSSLTSAGSQKYSYKKLRTNTSPYKGSGGNYSRGSGNGSRGSGSGSGKKTVEVEVLHHHLTLTKRLKKNTRRNLKPLPIL